MNGIELREHARRAFDGGQWRECYEHLAPAVAQDAPLEPEDAERLAVAAYLTGRDAESTDAWIRAHRRWLDRTAYDAAVRCAFWAGFGLLQRGEPAQGSGWLARASSLVEQHGLDGVERGYLLLPEALMAMGDGDPDQALDRFGQAARLAQHFGDRDLAALASVGRAEAVLRSGRLPTGMRLLDEAMVSVTAGETSPIVSGVVYCAVIEACQQAFDLRRAREWTAALARWCGRQPDLVPYRGQCLVHRAQILQLGGQWAEALIEAQRACERLAEPPHPAIGMAHYELAELHRLRGELGEAEAAYRRAHAAGRPPQPGLALLRLAEGRTDAAAATVERALDEAGDRLARAQILPAVVEVMVAAQRTAEARRAAEELAELAAGGAGGLLHAVAARARGAVLVAEGEHRAALDPLHAACRAWQELEAPYEAARTRVLIAAAYEAVGDPETAELERDAARSVFERLGASPALATLDATGIRPSGHAATPVTTREREVLRLVAAGRTNREIARSLGLSDRTVERHLSNIFTKLDVPNRAAATAYAYDHDLV
ncbi:MAG TPA: LuxR C-terminal-related transcriptional regulator [Mycobacteriales bacterium]|nr:LuxR C-terminal-related transcriptional regulator [Mycobacteriales bacterium]